MSVATITIRLDMPGVTVTNTIREALDALADIMLVQAEDGLYTLGSRDASDLWNEAGTEIEIENNHLVDFENMSVEVSV